MCNNKGFTLIETIFALSIIMLGVLITFHGPKLQSKKLEKAIIEAQIYKIQSHAMVYKQTTSLENTDVTYNENGNVNHAKTIYLNQNKCVIQLGMGRFYVE